MGAGCYGISTSPTLWGSDPKDWKGVLPNLPPFTTPALTGTKEDTGTALKFTQKELENISDRLHKAVRAKMSWLLSPTNNIQPTGEYALGGTYKIYAKAQAFIGELNLLANHDPNAQRGKQPTSKGEQDPEESGEDPAELAAFAKVLLKMEQITVADETIPQDPQGTGVSVPIFEVDANGNAEKVE